MKILFIGDIFGSPGRKIISENLKKIKHQHSIDFVIANAENSAHGKGLTKKIYKTLIESGIDFITMGNHTWARKEVLEILNNQENIIRPINLGEDFPYYKDGKGSKIVEINGLKGRNINLMGNSVKFKFKNKNAFEEINNLLNSEKTADINIIDFHAETTAEKYALLWAFNGKVDAILGTHTHVPTNDLCITLEGTAFVCDVGMTGPSTGIIGGERESIIKNFFNPSAKFILDVQKGPKQFSSVILEYDESQKRMVSIKPLIIREGFAWIVTTIKNNFKNMSETKFNLYKKYRPKTFKDVIGQDNIRNLLSQTLNKSVKLQSFIFYGPSGTGKTSLARIFAKACNCKFFTEIGDVCNKCENCLSIDNEETQDIWEIDAASFNGVEHMRGLIESTRYLPHFLKTKVYIVDEAHNLSGPAWNTLLKPTEEPISENIVFLFLTTNIHKIPETILNRCQKHGFSKLDNSEIEQLIDKVSKSEEKIIDNDAKQSLVSLSQGSARECLSLLNQLFLSTGNFVQISDVEKVFSLSNKQEMLDMIIHLKNKDLQNSLSLLEKFEKNNNHILNFFSSIFSAYIDLYLYRKTKNISLMKKLSEEEAKKLVDEKSDYLSYAKILERGIQSFNNFSNSLEREKIILFELWEVPEIINSTNKNTFKEINQNPKKEEIIEEKKLINFETKIKIPEIKDIQTKIELETPKESKQDWNFQVTLEKKETNEPQIISEEMEKNLIYGLNKKYIDQEKSEEIYEKYKRILDGEKPEYKEISYIFSKVTPPKIGKSKINGKKELLTTDKTVILPFSKKEHAEEFNELFKQPEIKEQLQECFIYDLEWIGVTNSLIKDSLKKIINKSEKTNTTPKIFEFKDDEFNEIIEILKD